MPFKSEKQRKYLWANEPEIARDWTDTYGSKIHKADGGRIGLRRGGDDDGPGPGGQGARGQATQNPGRGGRNEPPGGGATSQGSRRDYSPAPSRPSYQNVHQTGAITQTPGPKHTPRDQNILQRGINKAQQFNKAIQTKGIAGLKKKDLARYIAKLNKAGESVMYDDETETWEDLFPSYKDPNLFEEGRGYQDKTIEDFDTGKRTHGKAGIGPEFFVESPNFPSWTQIVGKALSGPITAEQLRHIQTQAGKLSTLDPSTITRDQYMQEFRPKTYARENIEQGGGGEGGGLPYIWPPYQTGAIEEDPTQETLVSDTDWNFVLPERFLKGPRVAQVAEGGRVPAAFGGIMDTETGRRGYAFGSFNPFKAATKLVKKAAKTVKKIAKSPIGKLALGYLATAGIGNIMQPGAAQWGGGLKPGGWLKPGQVMSNWSNLMSGTSGLDKLNPNEMKNVASGWKGIPSKVMDFAKTPTGMITLGGAGIGLASATGPEKLEAGIGGDRSEEKAWWDAYLASLGEDRFEIEDKYKLMSADGGRVPAETGGLMNLGGLEKDYRNDGGFVPLGAEERADDVPARLSKNEFVFTADAVRAAGGGDIDKGAEVMEDTMKTLEAKGGASNMFQTSQRLSEVV